MFITKFPIAVALAIRPVRNNRALLQDLSARWREHAELERSMRIAVLIAEIDGFDIDLRLSSLKPGHRDRVGSSDRTDHSVLPSCRHPVIQWAGTRNSGDAAKDVEARDRLVPHATGYVAGRQEP